MFALAGLWEQNIPSTPTASSHTLDGLFALAGVWESWRDRQGEAIETCTILTTEANELMRPCMSRYW